MPVIAETDTSITTVTLSLHEGSGPTVWRKTGNPDIFLCPNQIGNAWTDTIIRFHYSIIVRITVQGQEALLLYGRAGTLEDIYLRYDGHSADMRYEESHGFDTILEQDARRRITGNYWTENQRGWLITSEHILGYSLSALPDMPFYIYTYTVRWGETDSPEQILVLSDGRCIYYEMTADGLDLYNTVVHVEDDGAGLEWVSRGELLCSLIETDLDKAVPGRWPEASTRLLTRGYLEPYPTEVLRLIRNEIYARHGHRFHDPSLTDFYNKWGLWYGIAILQQQTELSPIEQLNVQLILGIEQSRRAQ